MKTNHIPQNEIGLREIIRNQDSEIEQLETRIDSLTSFTTIKLVKLSLSKEFCRLRKTPISKILAILIASIVTALILAVVLDGAWSIVDLIRFNLESNQILSTVMRTIGFLSPGYYLTLWQTSFHLHWADSCLSCFSLVLDLYALKMLQRILRAAIKDLA
jgi:asparagine N-glycosylation enzyme membrane subunit Stt3